MRTGETSVRRRMVAIARGCVASTQECCKSARPLQLLAFQADRNGRAQAMAHGYRELGGSGKCCSVVIESSRQRKWAAFEFSCHSIPSRIGDRLIGPHQQPASATDDPLFHESAEQLDAIE